MIKSANNLPLSVKTKQLFICSFYCFYPFFNVFKKKPLKKLEKWFLYNLDYTLLCSVTLVRIHCKVGFAEAFWLNLTDLFQTLNVLNIIGNVPHSSFTIKRMGGGA